MAILLLQSTRQRAKVYYRLLHQTKILLILVCLIAVSIYLLSGQVNAAQTDQLLPPTPNDIKIRLTKQQTKGVFSIPVGERFAVELIGQPTAGYKWMIKQLPAFVRFEDQVYGPVIDAQQHGLVGGNHWTVLIFKVVEAGTDELILEQRRPWETDGMEQFQITLKAQS